MRGGCLRWMIIAILTIAVSPLVVEGQSAAPWAGTWKLNTGKSRLDGPAPKESIVRLEASPNGVRTTIDSVTAQGTRTHTEATAVFDGKEYELKGAAVPTTRAYRRVGSDYEYTTRVNGKVTTTSRGAVSADGKTRTLTTTGTNAQGQTVNTVNVYDRQ